MLVVAEVALALVLLIGACILRRCSERGSWRSMA